MEVRAGRVTPLATFLHRHLLVLLVSAYVLAGLAPAAGLWLRSAELGTARFAGQAVTASLPALLLALLLFNAGLGVEPRRVRSLLGSSGILAAGLLANLAVPLLFILG